MTEREGVTERGGEREGDKIKSGDFNNYVF